MDLQALDPPPARSWLRERESSRPTKSTGTIEKRFASIDVESTEENRRAYREMLFTTPGFGEHIWA